MSQQKGLRLLSETGRGAAGFLGTSLLYRLLAPPFAPKRIFGIVRGSPQRLPKDLHRFIANPHTGGPIDHAKPLFVLDGDCTTRNFGFTGQQLKWLEEVDIVVHAAADIRWNLPLQQALAANVYHSASYYSIMHH